jgi:hypothetical protein
MRQLLWVRPVDVQAKKPDRLLFGRSGRSNQQPPRSAEGSNRSCMFVCSLTDIDCHSRRRSTDLNVPRPGQAVERCIHTEY